MADTTTTNTDDNKVRIKTAHPDPFDGSYAKYRSWIREVKIKVLADKLKTDEEKILCTLQYMKSGQALELRDAFLDKALENPDIPDFGTWKDFLELLDKRFTDQHFQTRAREKVENFTQDRLTIQEFIIRLELLFARAELTDEKEKTRIIKKNIQPEILRIVYNSDHLPDTYDEWREKIVKIGTLQEELHQIQRQRTTKAPAPPPTPQSKYNIVVQPKTTDVDKKTATGTTYGGRGQPMDIDRLKNIHCFNCGKLGHVRDKCPEPRKDKINVRELWAQLEDDEKDEFYVEIRAMEMTGESDF